jgi:hypothetical protein
MALVLWMMVAQAVTPELVAARVAETSAWRGMLQDRQKPAISADAYARAAAGDVPTGLVTVSGYSFKKAWGVGVVSVPIGRMWAAVNDDASKVAWTDLDYLEILSGRACQSGRRVFQFLPVPLLTDRWWVIDVRQNDGLASASGGRMREQSWATNGDFSLPTASTQAWGAKGMPIASTQGSWVLIDLDGANTLVEYYTWADPGGSIPASIANTFADSGIEGSVRTFEKLAKAGPGCPVW